MALLRCVDCGKVIEDSGAVEDDDYVCGSCMDKRAEEDAWLENWSEKNDRPGKGQVDRVGG